MDGYRCTIALDAQYLNRAGLSSRADLKSDDGVVLESSLLHPSFDIVSKTVRVELADLVG